MARMKVKIGGGKMGLCGALALLFIALKLMGTIAWSWWWVLAPIWLPVAGLILVFILAFVFAAIVDAVGGKRGSDEEKHTV